MLSSKPFNFSLGTIVTILLIDQFCITKFTPELLSPSAWLDPYMQHMIVYICLK